MSIGDAGGAGGASISGGAGVFGSGTLVIVGTIQTGAVGVSGRGSGVAGPAAAGFATVVVIDLAVEKTNTITDIAGALAIGPFGTLSVGGLSATGGSYAIDFGGAAFGYRSDLLGVNGAASLSATSRPAARSGGARTRVRSRYQRGSHFNRPARGRRSRASSPGRRR